jgi:hypothetical protein
LWTTSFGLFKHDVPNVVLGLGNGSFADPATTEWSFSLDRPIMSTNMPESFKLGDMIRAADDSARATADTEAQAESWDDWSRLGSDQHFWYARFSLLPRPSTP